MILSILLSADAVRGRRPRPGRRPPFHARGFHPVYNARVSSNQFTAARCDEDPSSSSINQGEASRFQKQYQARSETSARNVHQTLLKSVGTVSPFLRYPGGAPMLYF